jgi:acyl carrier protein
MNTRGELEQFILDELGQGTGIHAIAPEENLLLSGLMDSYGLITLIGFLETRYGISVDDADLKPDEFESIAAIEALITRKCKRATPDSP